jgi:uncharacterized protein (UPF0333 family)
MWYNIGGARRMKRAQAMLEYVLALAGMAVVASVMWYVVSAAEKQLVRTENLVSSEYP